MITLEDILVEGDNNLFFPAGSLISETVSQTMIKGLKSKYDTLKMADPNKALKFKERIYKKTDGMIDLDDDLESSINKKDFYGSDYHNLPASDKLKKQQLAMKKVSESIMEINKLINENEE